MTRTNERSTASRHLRAWGWILAATLAACAEELPPAPPPSHLSPPEELPVVVAPPPSEPLSCSTFHAEGWLMDCIEYLPGGAFLRTGRAVAESACAISLGTLSASGCPTDGSLGRCRDADFVLFYYGNRHETPTRAELRATCEEHGGTFEDP